MWHRLPALRLPISVAHQPSDLASVEFSPYIAVAPFGTELARPVSGGRPLFDVSIGPAKNPRWIPGYDRPRRNIFRDDTPRTHDGALTNRDAAQNHGPAADRGAPANPGFNHLPIRVRLERPFLRNRGRVPVVNKNDVVADETFIFNLHALANKSVAGNLAMLANTGPLLDFDKGSNARAVTNFAAVKVHESVDLYTLTQLNVGSNPGELRRQLHTGILFPPSARDLVDASRSLTTASPDSPLDWGTFLNRMHSTKC